MECSKPRIGYRKSACIRNRIVRVDPFERIRIHVNLKGHYKCHRYSVCQLTLEKLFFTTPDGSCTGNMKYYSRCGT